MYEYMQNDGIFVKATIVKFLKIVEIVVANILFCAKFHQPFCKNAFETADKNCGQLSQVIELRQAFVELKRTEYIHDVICELSLNKIILHIAKDIEHEFVIQSILN